MVTYEKDSCFIVEQYKDFDIEDILECGQCFHFTRLDDHKYEVVAKNRYLVIEEKENSLIFYNTSKQDYDDIWQDYFDMSTDYGEIKNAIIESDARLKDAVFSKSGIRIINQDFFETLISFIISQNKQIPHIKQIVHRLSEEFGSKVMSADGREISLFPTVEEMHKVTEEQLRDCKVGFRAPYIMDAVDKVYTGEITEAELRNMDADSAREKLMTIKGVGEKVANCVLLFGLHKTNSFPVDVWMKRIMEYMYFGEDTPKDVIEAFAYDRFGEYAGYAQQYLFCYGRESGLGKK